MFVAITCEEESSMLSQLHDPRGPQLGTFFVRMLKKQWCELLMT